jgi:hypothetical protein
LALADGADRELRVDRGDGKRGSFGDVEEEGEGLGFRGVPFDAAGVGERGALDGIVGAGEYGDPGGEAGEGGDDGIAEVLFAVELEGEDAGGAGNEVEAIVGKGNTTGVRNLGAEEDAVGEVGAAVVCRDVADLEGVIAGGEEEGGPGVDHLHHVEAVVIAFGVDVGGDFAAGGIEDGNDGIELGRVASGVSISRATWVDCSR